MEGDLTYGHRTGVVHVEVFFSGENNDTLR